MFEKNEDLKNLCSIRNKYIEFVRFINKTDRPVDVYWITFEGGVKLYKRLKKDEYFDVNTYVRHPWIFRDHKTTERLLGNGKRIFTLLPNHERIMTWLRREPVERIKVNITFPLRDLKTQAMAEILSMVQDEEALKSLELPHTLHQEILYCILQRHKWPQSDITPT